MERGKQQERERVNEKEMYSGEWYCQYSYNIFHFEIFSAHKGKLTAKIVKLQPLKLPSQFAVYTCSCWKCMCVVCVCICECVFVVL